jgi:uncharacterized OB-fold protein
VTAEGLRPALLPEPSDEDREFWDGVTKHELRAQRCSGCGALRWPPRPMCPDCNSVEHEWVKLSGRGTLYSYTVVMHPTHPSWEGRTPYLSILVELEEGMRMVSNLEAWRYGDDVTIDTPLVVSWREVEGVTLPQFRRA